MNTLLKLEELAQLLVCLITMAMHADPWWMYVLLAFGPDIGMLGYLHSPRIGAVTYNLLHHKGIALLLAGAGLGSAWFPLPFVIPAPMLLSTGIVLYGHACLDRLLGFGLKHVDSFRHTHLGWIGTHRRPGLEA